MDAKQLKRVLIVDDEPYAAQIISTSLEAIGDEQFRCDIANNGDEALAKIQKLPYTLLITDYNMPGMTGLDLAQAVRQISPATQVILMSAYGTDQLRKIISYFEPEGYIDKPFSVSKIQEIVKRVVGYTNQTRVETISQPSERQVSDEPINECLKSLHSRSGTRCVLLVSANGYPIDVVGHTNNLNIPGISALVAANFLAAAELAKLLGNSSVFKSSHHEGEDYNVYAYDINGEILLAVIFGTENKPGAVWFYTKQTAAKLAKLVPEQPTEFKITESELSEAVDVEFDKLFGNEGTVPPAEVSPGNCPVETVLPPVSTSNRQSSVRGSSEGLLKQTINSADEESLLSSSLGEQRTVDKKQQKKQAQPMSFEQAIASGLVPPEIIQRELDS